MDATGGDAGDIAPADGDEVVDVAALALEEEARALCEEIARRDEEARVQAYTHMHRRAQEGGLNANGSASGVPELVGTRGEVTRMLEYRLEHGDAATVRRARNKMEQLRTRSGARSLLSASVLMCAQLS